MTQRTLSIIKPDSVSNNVIGAIIDHLEKTGLQVIAAKMLFLSREKAELFYDIHRERPFFSELVEFMTAGPVLAIALEGENAINKNRDAMGATDPKQAEAGTIRAKFGKGIEANAVHGSDGEDTATREIAFFFNENEIFSKAKLA